MQSYRKYILFIFSTDRHCHEDSSTSFIRHNLNIRPGKQLTLSRPCENKWNERLQSFSQIRGFETPTYLFRVKRWNPLAVPLSMISFISFRANAMPNARTVSSSSLIGCNCFSSFWGISTLHTLAILMRALKFGMGNIPGIIGTVIPCLLQSSTNSTKTFDSKNICVIMKLAPASTYEFRALTTLMERVISHFTDG